MVTLCIYRKKTQQQIARGTFMIPKLLGLIWQKCLEFCFLFEVNRPRDFPPGRADSPSASTQNLLSPLELPKRSGEKPGSVFLAFRKGFVVQQFSEREFEHSLKLRFLEFVRSQNEQRSDGIGSSGSLKGRRKMLYSPPCALKLYSNQS